MKHPKLKLIPILEKKPPANIIHVNKVDVAKGVYAYNGEIPVHDNSIVFITASSHGLQYTGAFNGIHQKLNTDFDTIIEVIEHNPEWEFYYLDKASNKRIVIHDIDLTVIWENVESYEMILIDEGCEMFVSNKQSIERVDFNKNFYYLIQQPKINL